VDIFNNTINDSADSLEIERFKAKIRELWAKMLDEVYDRYYDIDDEDTLSKEEFIQENDIKFANEPEPLTELDNIMNTLDSLLEEEKEDLEDVQSEGKAPTYKGSKLKSNNEKGKTEATVYEVKSKTTKTPSDSRSGIKGGSYEGTPSGKVSKKKDDPVITKYSPLIEEIKDELKSLIDRQRIGRRKMRFRL
jgi:hypothetical protein